MSDSPSTVHKGLPLVALGAACALCFSLWAWSTSTTTAEVMQSYLENRSLNEQGRELAQSRGYPALESLDAAWFDTCARLAATTAPPDGIIALSIDEVSISKYKEDFGRWPWNRGVWAKLLEGLSPDEYRPRAILFDLMFSECNIMQSSDRASGDSGDGDFQSMLQASPNVVLSYTWTAASEDVKRYVDDLEGYPNEGPRELVLRRATPVTTTPLAFEQLRCRKEQVVPGSGAAHREFWGEACQFGWITSELDPGAVLRRTALVLGVKGAPHRLYPCMALAAVLGTQTATSTPRIEVTPEGDVLRDGQPVPRDARDFCTLPFRNTFRRGYRSRSIYSALESIRYQTWDRAYREVVASGDRESIAALESTRRPKPDPFIDPAIFKDKFVVIGTYAAGVGDLWSTPFAPDEPGMIKHVATLDALFNGTFRQRASLGTVVAVTCAAAFLSTLLYLKLHSPLHCLVGLAALGVALFWASWLAFVHRNMQLDVAAPGFCLAANFTGAVLWKYFVEGRQSREVSRMFGKYMSPEVVKRLLENPELVKPGGQARVLTAFFSDLANFTSLSETMTPPVLFEFINRYLSLMTKDILACGGYLDKYSGDGIMAVFGIEPHQTDHALDSCRAALLNKRHCDELAQRLVAEGKPQVSVRIGLNSGPMMAGNVGSEAKMNYTVIGDAVNLASRLEAANKPFHTVIMLGEETYALVKDRVLTRPLDLLAVKGKKQGIRVYELLGIRGQDALTPEQERLLTIYSQGIALYQNRQWEEARAKFQECLAVVPGDGPSQLYLERCEGFAKNPPPEPWDGVYRLYTK